MEATHHNEEPTMVYEVHTVYSGREYLSYSGTDRAEAFAVAGFEAQLSDALVTVTETVR